MFCSGIQHLRAAYPVLDFAAPSLSVFLLAHANAICLYQFLAAVVAYARLVRLRPP